MDKLVDFKTAMSIKMLELSRDPRVVFIGYNTACGPQMNGTLKGCEKSCIETPIAENLMCGIAMGHALAGKFPVLCFERSDFLLACMDALINHIGNMQDYGLILPMIIRVTVGCIGPFNPGSQHLGDYTKWFRDTKIVTRKILTAGDIKYYYRPEKITRPTMLVEYRSRYGH